MTAAPAAGTDDGLVLASGRGRWVLLATVLGSAIASIDATVVGIALPAIGRDFHASLGALQWVVTGYTLTLAGLLLMAGALGDKYGRKKVFVIGVSWFALASLLCGVAPSVGFLIGARALQGVGAALLTPGSLAILEAVFRPDDRSKAIGAWSGFSGVGTAVGPFLGGSRRRRWPRSGTDHCWPARWMPRRSPEPLWDQDEAAGHGAVFQPPVGLGNIG